MKLTRVPIILLVLLGMALAAQPTMLEGRDTVRFIVVVHRDNPTDAATRAQLSSIFFKRRSRWDNGLAVSPVDQTPRSPVRRVFSKIVHGKSVAAVEHFWQRSIFLGSGKPPPEVGSDQAVLEFVRGRPGAVGYVSAEAALESGDGIKVLEISDLSGYDEAPS